MTSTPHSARAERLPCSSLEEALPHLRRPPGPVAVRFKIQTPGEDAGQVAAYVDARFVYDRLDQVCGERWWARYAPLAKALVPRSTLDDDAPPPLYVRCQLTLYGVARQDVGEGRDPKAALSDAVKRAAVTFGVGRSLYAMRLPWLAAGEGEGELRRNGRGELVVDECTEAWCREKYERWLTERGTAQFGQPLEHRVDGAAGAPEAAGDTAGAPGDAAPAPIRAAV